MKTERFSLRRRACLLVLAQLVVPSASLVGQTSRGTVTGLVTDPQRAAISGAVVEVVNQATNVKRSTSSNEAGFFRLDAVDLGSYNVSVTHPGFQTFLQRAIPVTANQTVSLDVQLEIGQTQSVIEVVDQSETVLQYAAPVRGGNFNTANISQLPFATRNAVSLALTLPGVSSNRYGFGVGGSEGTFTANGSRGRSNNFLINGTENNDISIAGQGMQIKNPDAVAEVSVQTSNFDAEFGRAGGAVINVITKSGTNDLHGTLSYLLDSTFDDAVTNTQSLNAEVRQRGRPLPGTEQYYGGTVGGPILRNRTFFFGAFQEQRQNSQNTTRLVTLSAEGRATLNRLFPAGRNPRVDLYNAVTGPATADSQFFTVPLGSGRPDVQFGTLISPYAAKFRDRQIMGRVDHRVSDSDQLSFSYIISDQLDPQGGTATFFPGFSTSQANRYQNVVLTETHIFSPSLTNELRLPYNRIALSFPLDPANQLGLTLPRHTIAGGITALGVATTLPQGRTANNYSLQDTMTYIRGAHSFRFGLDILHQRSRQFAPIRERGELSYAASTGFSGFSNFIDDFGGSSGSAARDFGSAAYYPEMWRQAYFFQDRWRASSALTLTLGVRYEDFGTPMNSLTKPAFSGLFNLDPVTFDGPYRLPNKVARDRNNWSPTIGIAYSPAVDGGVLGWLLGNRKTVFRTGYQIGYDSFFNNIASNAAVATPNVVATTTPSIVSTALPRGLGALSSILPTTPRAPSALDSQTLMLGNLVNPYYQRWSFGIQRELPGHVIADISYVGSKGTRLFINEDLNPVVPVSMRVTPQTATPIPANRLSGRLDNLQGPRLTRTNGGGSNYHSLQTAVNRRLSRGLTVSASYTWSKLIDDGSEVFGVAAISLPQQAAVPSIFGGQARERAVSFFDRTHRAAFTYLYELPFLRDQRGLAGRVLGGWQISGTTTFETGVPMTVTNGVDADGLGGSLDRPLFNPSGQQGVRAMPRGAGFVNPDAGNAVIDPAAAMFIGLPAHTGSVPLPTGNLGRNTLRTPGINNFNVSFQKNVRIFERLRSEFRAEMYNIWNHPQYGVPSISPFSPGQQGISSNVFNSPAGRFLQPQFADGGSRVVRYQLKLVF